MFKQKRIRQNFHVELAAQLFLLAGLLAMSVAHAETVAKPEQSGEETVSLDFSTTGHLMIGSRVVSDPDVQWMPAAFTVSLDCSDDRYDNKHLEIAANGTHIVTSIPQGTTCTVTQRQPVAPEGHVFAAPVISPAQAVTITAGKMQAINMINQIMSPPTGV